MDSAAVRGGRAGARGGCATRLQGKRFYSLLLLLLCMYVDMLFIIFCTFFSSFFKFFERLFFGGEASDWCVCLCGMHMEAWMV